MGEIVTIDAEPAILALADGSIFTGISIGAPGQALGEVVFNTSITGYQEILTDPSYAKQIITLTYPHIGNVGVNSEDCESSQIWASGLVVRECSPLVSNWRAEQSLPEYLMKQGVVAIAEVDTRRLTRLLREKGAQNACIIAGSEIDAEHAVELARQFEGLEGMDLAKQVTCKKTHDWQQRTTVVEDFDNCPPQQGLHVVVYDFGVKQQILRLFMDRGCRVTVVPAETSVAKILELNPDGVFLSNGPGDPAACDYAIANVHQLLEMNIPLFGICLGFQIMALACGAKTFKMKFGHHGANHPVQDLQSRQVMITAQNHGFAVDEDSLAHHFQITHRSLFDNTVQGIRHLHKPAFAFQGHPEASGGPHDIVNLFDQFVELIKKPVCLNEPI
ncbi:MAG: glutamine-hydrolyzing carbamoyl-phosphate synthase small subunit [Gammaproteobacteria bacterium]|nr:glutamine-hydrolyzing carbamoyl-phosphate synthase small subunit [Gammaproteobacteria bacterium]MCH9743802.1 glutamine-hydrolyzing carbamoyl-phosphate synthase small subunit [Gammaproteobacteria bacterium]